MKRTKTWIIFCRLRDLILYAFIAAIIYTLAFPVYLSLLNKVAQYLGNFHSIVKYASDFLSLILLIVVLHRMGGIRLRDFYTIRLWLPIWKWAILLAVTFSYFMCKFIDGYEFATIKRDWILLALILPFINWPIALLATCIRKLYASRYKDDKSKKGQEKKIDLENFEKLIEWLGEEKPIENPAEDRYEMDVVARRLARILREKSLKTIGLTGQYGCGKSGILNMVEYYLDNSPQHDEGLFDPDKIIICNIHGWAFRKETAARVILRQTVAELSKHVDCLGLTHIPEAYQKALSDSGSWWLKIISLGIGRKTATEQLEKLDSVLLCVGMRMVVFIEDLDRNVQREESISEISGLLDRLKILWNISFVLAIHPNVNLSDLEAMRISEHIEVIPSLPKRDVISIVRVFRTNCLNQFGEDIDCISRQKRDERWGPEKIPLFELEEWHEMTGGHDRPVFSIPKLLTGPRLLKQSLRHTWQAWKNLRGEIDFDDLLMVNVIRFAAPEAFDFMHKFIVPLRIAEDGKFHNLIEKRVDLAISAMNKNGDSDTGHNVKQIWNDHVKDSAWDAEAAYNLLETLFPGITDWGHNTTLGPQCIGQTRAYTGNTDYWTRLNAQELGDNEIRDQEILHAIEEWKEKIVAKVYKKYKLAEAMLHIEGFAEKFQQFGFQLNDQYLNKLTRQYFALIREKVKKKELTGDANTWPCFLELSGVIRKYSGEALTGEFILKEIIKTLPVSMELTHHIYRFYYKIFYPSKKLKIHINALVKRAKEIYKDPAIFIGAVKGAEKECVVQFVNRWGKQEKESINFNQWIWLGIILVESFKQNPEVIIPQIAQLVIRYKEFDKGWSHESHPDDDSIWSMFKGGKREVMELLADAEIDLFSLDKDDLEVVKNFSK